MHGRLALKQKHYNAIDFEGLKNMNILKALRQGTATYAEEYGWNYKLDLVFENKAYSLSYTDLSMYLANDANDMLEIHEEGTSTYLTYTIWDICDRYPNIFKFFQDRIYDWMEWSEIQD